MVPTARAAALCWAAAAVQCAAYAPEPAGLPLHARRDKGAAAIAEHVTRTVEAGKTQDILKAFDTFSTRERLGMQLGEEKGNLIMMAVKRGLPEKGPMTVLETGCHAGDGSLWAATIAGTREGSTLISTEANELWLDAAKKVVAHGTSGMKGFKFLPMQLAENADFGQFLDTLRNEHGIKTLDAVILDQDQSQFASQVKLMLEKDMLRKGSTIYVDNVATKKAKLKEYLTLVKGRDSKKFWSEPHEVSRPYEDAVLISTYLADSVEL